MHDYVYMIKRCGGFVAVTDFTLRVTFSQNPRCQLWFNSWMSLIKITKQHVATWSEHVWLISVTVDAVYKVCPCRWWWCRNSSQMQPSSWLVGLNVEHLSHVCRWRLVNSCSDKGLCKFKWHQKSFLHLWYMTVATDYTVLWWLWMMFPAFSKMEQTFLGKWNKSRPMLDFNRRCWYLLLGSQVVKGNVVE